MPPSDRGSRHARRRVRAAALGAVLAAAVAAVAGCGPEPADGRAAIDGLLVLTADDGGRATLEAWSWVPSGGVDGSGAIAATAVATPGDGVAWVGSGRGRVLAATMLDGSLHTSDPLGRPGALAWRPVEAVDATGDPPPGPAWFATWDPEGGRFATIAGDLPGGGDVALTLIDPSTGSAFVIPLDRAVLPSAPAWIDGELVALVGGSTTEPLALLVDTTDGSVEAGPRTEPRFASSADGRVVAGAGAAGSAVVVRSTAAWLDGEGTAIGTIDAPKAEARATALALDADGDRLAIVWQGVDGGLRIDVHDGADGWRRVGSPALPPGSAGAVVAWAR